MSDPILAKVEKCTAAWETVRASSQHEPLPLYCPEHDKWQLQHNEVARAWRDGWSDLLATPPMTRQGAIALIEAFLLYQGAEVDRREYSELLARLKAFLQSAP
jgi:hypothetical protein